MTQTTVITATITSTALICLTVFFEIFGFPQSKLYPAPLTRLRDLTPRGVSPGLAGFAFLVTDGNPFITGERYPHLILLRDENPLRHLQATCHTSPKLPPSTPPRPL